ncbi:DNA adenine methylase [Macrococcoides caseolyticum]|uniref:Site-specific DNA-methyltransferase (adenine-specific) n=2 Tax=Macrococcoides TaxID=3076173 RepID=B9EC96_MACCJ|nr:Dam family site-specific DNA-(adenine-N6)-methyltransferase [Macrococcus caseolyticus]AXE75011.1 Adenine-specific DNA methylase [Macrococcus canis]BAH18704.1 DNA methyltransferase homologue [Macrococcus caseolyticus JCSC5402]
MKEQGKKLHITKQKGIRSPLFYVGDKYKLMPQLTELFPKEISKFYDVFCGGGSASMNTSAQTFHLNDIDPKVMEIHYFLQKHSNRIEDFIFDMRFLINEYGLSHSEMGKNQVIQELKKEHKKTYFSKYNKESYIRLREFYNQNQHRTDILYLLLIYGFNHMIRFNKKGEFNLPVGNVDWNSNVSKALNNYAQWSLNNEITLTNLDFEEVLNREFSVNDFIYLDPPYLISSSEYNKNWNQENEKRLYDILDKLEEKGVKWGLSNIVTDHHGNHNTILENWMKKYQVYKIHSNYISRFDNTIKDTNDVYVTNIK